MSTPKQLMNLIERGGGNRSTGSTSANADSSRSHAVLQLSLKMANGARGRNSRSQYSEHGR